MHKKTFFILLIANSQLFAQNAPILVDHKTELMIAAQNGDIEAIKNNLHQIRSQNQLQKRSTALMYAAHNGHHECVELLLEELGMQDTNGNTALSYALIKKHEKCIQLLIQERTAIQTPAQKHMIKHEYEDKFFTMLGITREINNKPTSTSSTISISQINPDPAQTPTNLEESHKENSSPLSYQALTDAIEEIQQPLTIEIKENSPPLSHEALTEPIEEIPPQLTIEAKENSPPQEKIEDEILTPRILLEKEKTSEISISSSWIIIIFISAIVALLGIFTTLLFFI